MYKNFEKANYHNFRSEIAHDSVRVLFLQITVDICFRAGYYSLIAI